MPESAEVRLMADTLESIANNKGIVSIELLNPTGKEKWINRNVIGLNKFKEWIQEHDGFLPIESINTKGKLCWIQCVDNIHIQIQFGMSGNFRVYPTEENLKIYNENRKLSGKKPESLAQYLKHCHIKIGVASKENPNNIDYVMYHDFRRFGRWVFSNSPYELKSKLNKLGTDPLVEKLSDEEILQKFRRFNHQDICNALMDNKIVSGVGNYIKSSTLYNAKIYPLAIVKDIPDPSLIQLYHEILKIAQSAYDQQGASLYTYSGVKGEQSNFKEELIIYGHEGEKDPNGYTIIRIPEDRSPDKRSTFWVPEVQTIGHVNNQTNDPNNENSVNANTPKKPLIKKTIQSQHLNKEKPKILIRKRLD